MHSAIGKDCFMVFVRSVIPCWRHEMETFSALLVICAGKLPVSGEVPAQRPVTQSFDVFFDQRPNKRLIKQSWGRWFETHSSPLWRHSNDTFCVEMSLSSLDCVNRSKICLELRSRTVSSATTDPFRRQIFCFFLFFSDARLVFLQRNEVCHDHVYTKSGHG